MWPAKVITGRRRRFPNGTCPRAGPGRRRPKITFRLDLSFAHPGKPRHVITCVVVKPRDKLGGHSTDKLGVKPGVKTAGCGTLRVSDMLLSTGIRVLSTVFSRVWTYRYGPAQQ